LAQRKGLKDNSLALPEQLCRQFLLTEIKKVTNNFHQDLIIGEVGFGYVYKGQIDDNNTTVAIKRMNLESWQGANEFKMETIMLSQLRHVHLVSLIGYCNEGGEMILVYDYMPKRI
jgi:serine/threonine protein kinase